LLSAIRHGFLYQGQYYSWQQQPRGSPLRRQDAQRCVQFIQNHDQVGNTFIGDRLHALSHPGRYRAMTALLLLAPQTPLLFMGQEFLSSRRFGFFADHHAQLRPLVHRGRREFLAQFTAYADPATQQCIPDPAAEATFTHSKLDWEELETHATALALHASLLQLRRDDAAARSIHPDLPDGATLNEQALALRWWRAGEDRLLIVNLGDHIVSSSIAEPLLAPPRGRCWQLLWSSEDVRYGGNGIASPVDERNQWAIPANCAILLSAAPDVFSREPKQ
jgi:maltooligosyltrehalose trehalohydrolase